MPALSDLRRRAVASGFRSATLTGDLGAMRARALAPERQAVVAALRDADGNVGRAAAALGSSRRTLQNRMREFGLPPGKSGRPREFLPFKAPLVGDLTTRKLVIGGVAIAGGFAIGYGIARWLKSKKAKSTSVGEADGLMAFGCDQ